MKANKTSKNDEPTSTAANGRLGEIEGLSVVTVIRGMGKNRVKFQIAKTILADLGITPSDGTIRRQLGAGRRGVEGAAAPRNLIRRLVRGGRPVVA